MSSDGLVHARYVSHVNPAGVQSLGPRRAMRTTLEWQEPKTLLPERFRLLPGELCVLRWRSGVNRSGSSSVALRARKALRAMLAMPCVGRPFWVTAPVRTSWVGGAVAPPPAMFSGCHSSEKGAISRLVPRLAVSNTIPCGTPPNRSHTHCSAGTCAWPPPRRWCN